MEIKDKDQPLSFKGQDLIFFVDEYQPWPGLEEGLCFDKVDHMPVKGEQIGIIKAFVIF